MFPKPTVLHSSKGEELIATIGTRGRTASMGFQTTLEPGLYLLLKAGRNRPYRSQDRNHPIPGRKPDHHAILNPSPRREHESSSLGDFPSPSLRDRREECKYIYISRDLYTFPIQSQGQKCESALCLFSRGYTWPTKPNESFTKS